MVKIYKIIYIILTFNIETGKQSGAITALRVLRLIRVF
jgi:hypothetical protein